MKNLTIIGGGPAALMLAAQIDTKKYRVTLCEKKKTVGRKFLVAGEGGLNLTYNCSIEDLINQYSPSAFMGPILRQFTNEDLMNWLQLHEVSIFIGSSNRVFPESGMKPIEVLKKFTDFIAAKGIKFNRDTTWLGWDEKGHLNFEKNIDKDADIVVYAMGGASWKITGSDGLWSQPFKKRGIQTQPFRAANCAFEVDWKPNFITTHEGKPLKNIALTFKNTTAKGELVISKFGLEGNAIYALSQKVQENLLTEKNTVIYLDLKPTMAVFQLKEKYKKSPRTKVTEILKKDINLDRTSIGILKHFTNKETFSDPEKLITGIKSVPITIKSSGELDKAISSLGGVSLSEIDVNFQLKKLPNSYAIGEMLDWYAPTGGYLLQGCFSMGFVLANHLNELNTE
jgi:uncharacterized flavoprotein (TIGR03862 family)